MQEKYIEKKLVAAVKSMGGGAPKFVSPGIDGMPDRIVLLPMVRIAFVECKATGKKMRPLQIKRKKQLEALGYLVYCLDDVEQIVGILIEIQAT
ncbi:VRR-NUC domain-containing protein [Vagococcus fluvialis]|uniref:VRR-NUC domain-containing protein n=2 Tax=Lactobacillales TaxID=186826 RepID=UPI0020337F84|nr:VRR-NUC domain-containing protein [Vagococcus fluvialis]MCM2137900.1 VRR-NUC domain-containing protein [Vagococcus fluvialis]